MQIAQRPRALRLAPLQIADGTLEALKWAALALMLLDHVNTFLYNRTLPGAYQAGRWVAPVFAFVLAYNLARPDALERALHLRVMRRLALFGALATPAHWLLVGNWWPLNILITLLAGAAAVYGLDRGGAFGLLIAGLAIVAGGLLGDYLYPGVAMFIAAWAYCREPTGKHFAAWVLFTASLALLNGNFWALSAVPALMLASQVQLRVPRLRWVFYAVYPVHLYAIWLVRDWRRLPSAGWW
ncbi:TraX family protein [Piscinibacter sp. XHJ-5]|uniref:TraX family protein n=1 Tax=Piscinibacter sp. XHJ-5 TaxID=3037797 RepID=UPI002452A450|nr:TraX family protein [Piscinibacter sp. XHJ-5]